MIRLISTLSVAGQIAAIGLYYAIPFWQGYCGDDLELSDFVVYCFLTLLAISFLVLVGLLILALVQKRHRLWSAFAMLSYLAALFLVRDMQYPDIMWVYGIKERVLHDYTPDDLRQFVKTVKNAGIVREGGGNFNGWNAINTDLNETQKQTITELIKKYYFLSGLDTGPSILTYPNEVTFQWGGGEGEMLCICSITLDGKKPDSTIDPRLTVLPVSDDIIFCYSLPDDAK